MGKEHGMIGNIIGEKNNSVPNLYKNSGTEIQNNSFHILLPHGLLLRSVNKITNITTMV
jgi:hypothetical protein